MNQQTPFRAMTIAGSDSGGGAGLQADLKTFQALGVYGTSIVTALTAQNTQEVRSIFAVDPLFIKDQLNAVLEDIGTDAVKIGMLFDPLVIETVAERLRHFQIKKIVLDPVMIAKSGDRLLQFEAIEALRELLLPLADLITPNLPEAEVLLGRKITDNAAAMEAAAFELQEKIGPAVLLKGGHSLDPKQSADCLALRAETRTAVHWLQSERIPTRNTHGTGCTLSAAVAAFLARGQNLLESVQNAKKYLQTSLAKGIEVRIGKGHGPACPWPPSFF